MDGRQSLVPHLVVDGAAAAIDFYRRAFGAEEVMRVPAHDGRRLMHAELRVNGASVYLCDHFPEFCSEASGDAKVAPPPVIGGTGVTLHLDVPSCDEAVAKAEAAGATVTMPPQDTFWGARYARIRDPFGHSWSIAHPLAGGRAG
ncbi:VOC family protein [Chelatococcus composti]|jgi:PhnB protein|uniref:PhnB protein n=1 Tax=Chelatococcus composti TaxID=1743235 RepID=A0A841K696_9HYPH|nr:VOC family protein [Chelatococcus composti]MBB6168328.1 PhnB protein [Chelatococcus composti]MBS7736589.1 VOC family protein [Chelatococcus composti]GGG39187.1 glyoxalase [Chelatococcus composti]